MATVPFSKLDGSNNLRQFQTSQLGTGYQLDNDVIADAATGLTAQVANHTGNNQNLPSTVYSLLVGAVGKLMNATGVNFDAWRSGGTDAGSAAGIAAIGPMLEQEIRATSTTTVAATATSATMSVAVTTGFIVGAPAVLEPDTANAETALITAVVTNTSVAVQFPPGGAAFTHTANFTLLTGRMNAARQAPGALGVAAVSSDGQKATYRYSVTGITPVATPTDFLAIEGSATKTGRIKSIRVGGHATAAGKIVVQLLRRSTAGTPGSASLTAITPMTHDVVNDPAATLSVFYVQTANYSVLGTLVAQGGVRRLYLNTDAGGPATEAIWDFATHEDKALIVRGTGDYVWVNLAGSALPTGATLDLEILVEEDLS